MGTRSVRLEDAVGNPGHTEAEWAQETCLASDWKRGPALAHNTKWKEPKKNTTMKDLEEHDAIAVAAVSARRNDNRQACGFLGAQCDASGKWCVWRKQ